MLAIVASCVVATQQGQAGLRDFSDPYAISDFLLNVLFVMEIIAKVIAHGLILHPKAYLRSTWNVFDFIVVLFGKFA